MSASEIFRSAGLPVLQNRVFETAAEAIGSPRGDVVLVQDPATGLVHNQSFDPSAIIYDERYQNEQACSTAFQRHLADVTRIIDRYWRGRAIIEIGCGKAYFLERLLEAGFNVTGIDPAYQGTNSRVVKARFEPGLGLSAEGIVLRHVLEHIPDPAAFLSQIAAANGGGGTVYIEVPCFDWIREHRAWFDIFYEHVNYFRPQDFLEMFGQVHEIGHLFGGQYIFVVADLASLRGATGARADRVELPADFLSGVNRAAARARQVPRQRTAVWGGSSKGVIFSLFMQRAGVPVDAVIDINPAKQGRYLPATGLRVSSPEEAMGRLSPSDTIFVMNSNYLDEIKTCTGGRFSYFPVDHDHV